MKLLKKLLGFIPQLIVIAALAGIIYATQNPDILKEIETFLNDKFGEEEVYVEMVPIKDLSPQFALPESIQAVVRRGYYVHEDLPVYTVVKTLDSDLYIPWRDGRNIDALGEMFLYDEAGAISWVKELDAEIDQVNGYFRIAGESFQDAGAGDYWAGILVGSEDNPEEQYYSVFYVSIQEECSFRSSQVGIANRGRFQDSSIVYRSGDPGVTYQFYNLGDNFITKVWYITRAPMSEQPAMKRLKEGEYSISEDGRSVTILPAFLDKQRAPADMHFTFGLADGSDVSTTDMYTYFDVSLLVMDEESDIPYMEGPDSYSVSSGEDYVLTIHQPAGTSVYKDPTNRVRFYNQDGIMPELSSDINPDHISSDETYVVSAELMRKAYEQGAKQVSSNIIFDFGRGSFTHWTAVTDILP